MTDRAAQGRANPFRVFRHRDFRLYWWGQLVSQVGVWMQTAAQAWLVLQLTESPFLLGLVTAAQTLPMLLLSLPAGSLADRAAKRPLLLIIQSVMAIQAFVLSFLVWFGVVEYWHILVLAAVLGVTRTYDIPIRQAFIIEMVGREDLTAALAMNSGVFNGARIFGPALAGMVMASLGAGWAFFLNGVSFLAIIYGFLIMSANSSAADVGPTRGMWREAIDGLAYVRRERRVMLVLLSLGFIGTFVQNYGLLIPVLAKIALAQSATGYGFLMAAMGIGAVIASVGLAAKGGDQPSLGYIFTTAALLSGVVLVIGLIPSYWLAFAAMVVVGAMNIIYATASNATVQLSVPDHLRGRVMSIYNLIHNGISPAGSVFLGAMMSEFGPRAGWTWAGGVGLASIFVIALVAVFGERSRGVGASTGA